MKIYLDIETIPSENKPDLSMIEAPAKFKKEESIKAWLDENGEKERELLWRKESLIAERGRILCIGYAIENDKPKCVDTLEEFYKDLYDVSNPIFIGHNIRKFDAPWMFKHAIKQKVKVPELCHFNFNKFRGNIEDTMELWACDVYNSYTKLDAIAKFLGVGSKTEGIDGSKVFDYWQAGRIEEIKDYCKQDVELTRSVYKRIKGIK